MKKLLIWFFVITLVVSSISLSGCTKEEEVEKEGKIKVVTTIYPPYDFVREIAGDKVDVKMLLRPGADSHSYEPSPQDMLAIKNCDVFIYIGGHADTWIDDILNSVENDDMKVIAMTGCVRPLKTEITEGMEHHHDGEEHYHDGEEHHHDGEEHHHDGEEHHHDGEEHHHDGEEHHHDGEEHHHDGEEHHHDGEEHHHDGEEHHHDENNLEDDCDCAEPDLNYEKVVHLPHSYDEHVWTSPANAAKIVEIIKKTLVDLDKNKDNQKLYIANAKKYQEKLNKLDKEIETVVKNGKRKTLVVADRFPFRYFAERYGLNYYAAFSGCSGQTDASASTIAFLIDKVKEVQPGGLITVEMSDQKIAKSIQEETGLKIYTLSAAHNITKEEFESKKSYLEIMKENKKVLEEVLN